MGERKIYHVLSSGNEGCWKAKDMNSKKTIFEGDVKEEVIQKIKYIARKEPPSQVVVYNKDGSIQYESLYDDTTQSNEEDR